MARDYKDAQRIAVPIEVVGTLDANRHSQMDVLGVNGVAPTLDTMHEPKKIAVPIGIIDPQGRSKKPVEPQDISPTLRAQTHGNEPCVVIPVLTPDRVEKRQNGRRFKEDGDDMFTLTAQDRHGVAVGIAVAQADEEGEHPGLFVQLAQDCIVYAIWYDKYECYIAIRKLTPRECFRLQGWEDEYFDRAQMVNSDSQLYKQAGNGVTVKVIQAIAEKIKA